MPAPPKWAQELLLDACLHRDMEEVPTLHWRRAKRSRSSGNCHYKTSAISVYAGRDRTDAKLVLLHELAHVITTPILEHSDSFWDIAWELYRWAKLPIRYCLKREGEYKKGALVGYFRFLRED